MITEDDIGLIRWYVTKRMSKNLLNLAYSKGYSLDDIIQEACLHFLKFPPKEGVVRTTALCNTTFWAMMNLLKNKNLKNKKTYLEYKGNNYEDINNLEDREIVDMILNVLEPKDAEILINLFGLHNKVPQSCGAYGKKIGVSKQAVSVASNRTLDSLRNDYRVKRLGESL
ncbi:MAG: hypothetical protein KGI50_05540 [Patescibacteria group bacterium]|nr:hypothetical protein [Patescibacteria group bacterium]MDE2438904.1 hypothetical protein [Patescibacteria group bacterium]